MRKISSHKYFVLVFPHGALTGSSPFPVLHSRRTKRKAIELRFIALFIFDSLLNSPILVQQRY